MRLRLGVCSLCPRLWRLWRLWLGVSSSVACGVCGSDRLPLPQEGAFPFQSSASTSAPAARAQWLWRRTDRFRRRRPRRTIPSRLQGPHGRSRIRTTGGPRVSRRCGPSPVEARASGLVDRRRRAVRPDARRRAARRARRGAAAGDHLVRSADRAPSAAGWTSTIGQRRLLELTLESGAHQLHAARSCCGSARTSPRSGRACGTCCCRRTTSGLRLSGEYATDVADASGTLMLDVARRRWSRRDARRPAGIDATLLPDVFESPRCLRARLARRRGGHGPRRRARRSSPARAIRRPARSAWASRGRAPSARRSARPASSSRRPSVQRSIRKGRIHTFCHAVPGRWHVMGVTQAAGLSLRWLRDQFGATRTPIERRPATNA